MTRLKLSPFQSQNTSVVQTQVVPHSATQPALLSQLLQEHPMGTTPTAKHILRDHSVEANDHLTREPPNYLWGELGKTPEPCGAAQRKRRYGMHVGARWWIDCNFATEYMYLVAAISKTNCGSIEV